MCQFLLAILDQRKPAHVVGESNCRLPADHPRTAVKSKGKSSEAIYNEPLLYLCSPSNCQPKFKRAVIRSGLQVTSQFHRPFPCDPLRHGCAEHYLCFIDQFRFQDFIERYKAVIIYMTIPTSYPATFTRLSEHIVVKRRHCFERYRQGKKLRNQKAHVPGNGKRPLVPSL
jgi:hypothetical protein